MEPVNLSNATNLPDVSGHRPFRILLVEDIRDNQLLIRAFLKPLPYLLDIAENGALGMEKFIAGTYDLVLMDMQMPVMDGFTACRLIRQWEKAAGRTSTPIIAFTANATQDETEKSLAAGCTSLLTKPIRKAEFLAVIARYAAKEAMKVAVGGHPTPKMLVRVDRDLEPLIPRFIDNRRLDITTLQTALEQGDYETIRNLAHGLKGAGAGYGFEAVSVIGAALEESAKRQNNNAIRLWLQKLAEYMDQVEVVFE